MFAQNIYILGRLFTLKGTLCHRGRFLELESDAWRQCRVLDCLLCSRHHGGRLKEDMRDPRWGHRFLTRQTRQIQSTLKLGTSAVAFFTQSFKFQRPVSCHCDCVSEKSLSLFYGAAWSWLPCSNSVFSHFNIYNTLGESEMKLWRLNLILWCHNTIKWKVSTSTNSYTTHLLFRIIWCYSYRIFVFLYICTLEGDIYENEKL